MRGDRIVVNGVVRTRDVREHGWRQLTGTYVTGPSILRKRFRGGGGCCMLLLCGWVFSFTNFFQTCDAC